jgi:hypothetical protein
VSFHQPERDLEEQRRCRWLARTHDLRIRAHVLDEVVDRFGEIRARDHQFLELVDVLLGHGQPSLRHLRGIAVLVLARRLGGAAEDEGGGVHSILLITR